MSENTSMQEVKDWKQQYYNHLDLLDQKEKDWQGLESILKKAVLRLSIAAEGQHMTMDRHLRDIRSVVKKQVNVIRLENILDNISSVLLKMVDQKKVDDKKVVTMLVQLLENIDFPELGNKKKKKLIKKLTKSSDKDSDDLVSEVQSLLAVSINQLAGATQREIPSDSSLKKSGLLRNLFNVNDKSTNKKNSHKDKCDDAVSFNSVVDVSGVIKAAPWPDNLEKDVATVLKKISACDSGDIDEHFKYFFSLIRKWQEQTASEEEKCFQGGVDDVSVNLIAGDMMESSFSVSAKHSNGTDEHEFSAQDILIRLLEKLTFPEDMYEELEAIKQRIQEKNATHDWKQILKDVAQLVNALRDQMQEEKQEFESFLEQITSRLIEMDGFLSVENASLNEAAKAGDDFDVAVSAQVKEIHDDMNMADDLYDLKTKVHKRLNVVSDHIKQYRINEQDRYTSAQQNVENMQSRLKLLEQESEDLKKLIVEKNREAMFDVLTEIPNRLAYEKKALEEIARCNRFSTPLSMVVWDVDLFKKVNDTYGHKVGDKVLRSIAQLLNERMRETDFIARYGGEEFVMFLPGADEDNALEIAEVLREKISRCKFKHHDEVLNITVSCGISVFHKNDSHEIMFERADKALYEAKRRGRNRCLTASSLN